MRSIQESWLKIKHLGRVGAARAGEEIREWTIPALVVVVGVASFGLGQLAALEAGRPVVDIHESSSGAKPRALALGGQFVALRTGTVYYFPWCSGAQQIPPEKQVWFVSENAAKKAGYRPAKNCRGLGM
jgi:hypothetical protein